MSANTSSFKDFSVKLRKARPEVYSGMRKGLRTAGKLISDKAVDNALSGGAGRHVERTMRVRALNNTVRVSAGDKAHPYIAWFEAGRTTKSKVWKHPVFPFKTGPPFSYRKAMVPMMRPHRPFLKLALLEMRRPAADVIAQAVVEAIADVLD
jgi:hypothetical protein